jgi:hypothetical protein
MTDVADSVVRILAAKDADHAVGTGFVVNERGYILTCSHVLEQCGKEVWVQAQGFASPVKAIYRDWWRDATADFALLKIVPPVGNSLISAKLDNDWRIGDTIHTLGYQYEAEGFSEFPATGRLTGSTTRTQREFIVAEDATNVQPGISGAPAFNSRTQAVLGILAEKNNSTNTALISPLAQVASILSTRQGASSIDWLIYALQRRTEDDSDDKLKLIVEKHRRGEGSAKIELYFSVNNTSNEHITIYELGMAEVATGGLTVPSLHMVHHRVELNVTLGSIGKRQPNEPSLWETMIARSGALFQQLPMRRSAQTIPIFEAPCYEMHDDEHAHAQMSRWLSPQQAEHDPEEDRGFLAPRGVELATQIRGSRSWKELMFQSIVNKTHTIQLAPKETDSFLLSLGGNPGCGTVVARFRLMALYHDEHGERDIAVSDRVYEVQFSREDTWVKTFAPSTPAI